MIPRYISVLMNERELPGKIKVQSYQSRVLQLGHCGVYEHNFTSKTNSFIYTMCINNRTEINL